MATDVSKVKPYTPASYPVLSGSEALYFSNEFRKIAQSITTIREVMVKLETRIAALGG